MLWKSHHSFCDGVSMVLFNLAISKEFDRSYFVKSVDLKLHQRIMVRAMVPLSLMIVAKNLLLTLSKPLKKNMVTKNKKNMTGVTNAISSGELEFPKMKALSKYMGMTINDIIMCALSMAMKRVFEENGDPCDDI